MTRDTFEARVDLRIALARRRIHARIEMRCAVERCRDQLGELARAFAAVGVAANETSIAIARMRIGANHTKGNHANSA